MLPTKSREDLDFELMDIEQVNLGESFSVTVNINVSIHPSFEV